MIDPTYNEDDDVYDDGIEMYSDAFDTDFDEINFEGENNDDSDAEEAIRYDY